MLGKLLNFITFSAIVIIAAICAFTMYNWFSVKNQEVGDPVTAITKEKMEEVINFDLGYIEFEPVEKGNGFNAIYTYTNYSSKDFDGSKIEYALFFNDTKLVDTQSLGSISSTLIKNFYGIANDIVATVEININCQFTVTGSIVTFSTTSSSNDLSYMNTYMNIFGATIKIAQEV